MLASAERAWFRLCLAAGRLLRAGTYSTVRISEHEGVVHVRKVRSFYAPLLIGLGGALVRILGTGVRVLPQRDWEERERLVYRSIYGQMIGVDADGTVVLPCLPGRTLAMLLDDPHVEESVRRSAIERAVAALVEFHRLGFTHGDAMAENVLVDVDAGVAHWFDFETVHDVRRDVDWRRADDLRALLATCVLRTARGARGDAVHLMLDVYADESVTRLLHSNFTTVWRRPLIFHLGQAPLSFETFREIGRLLR